MAENLHLLFFVLYFVQSQAEEQKGFLRGVG